ncbi:MAG: type II secretion system F family protein, partial [Alphaproteobacteria bacterium]
MAVFAYRGLTPDGRNVRGVVDADSARGARARLRRDGIFPTSIDEERRREAPTRQGGGRVRPADLALVSRQLGTLVGAGMPVVEAIGAVAEQTERPAMARVLSHVRDAVTQGQSLADSMAAHPAVFPTLYVGMVRAGEAAGA